MPIFEILNEMSDLNDRLEAAVSLLHDKIERDKMDCFRAKYQIFQNQLVSQFHMVLCALTEYSE